MPVYLTEGGARPQAAHDGDQIFGIYFSVPLLVIQGEALLELCRDKVKAVRHQVRQTTKLSEEETLEITVAI